MTSVQLQFGFDHILTEFIGGHGIYQWKLTILMGPVYSLSAILIFLNIFTVYAPKHRCHVSNCEMDRKVCNLRIVHGLQSRNIF